MKSYLLSLLGIEREIDPIVIKNANQYVSFKFADLQLLDFFNFLGGTTNFFSESVQDADTKGYFPNECFENAEQLHQTQRSPYQASFNKLIDKIPLEKVYSGFQILLDCVRQREKHYLTWIDFYHPQLDKKTINTWSVCGNKKKWVGSNTFWQQTTPRQTIAFFCAVEATD